MTESEIESTPIILDLDDSPPTDEEMKGFSAFGIMVDHDEQTLTIYGCGDFVGDLSIPLKHLQLFIETLTIQLQKEPETLSASLCPISVADEDDRTVLPASLPLDPSPPSVT